jgi:hypothetical protein
VPGRVGVHEKWLVRIIGSVELQAGAERKRSLMLHLQIDDRRHSRVEVQHLWSRALWPGWLRQLRYLLKCQRLASFGVAEH